MHRAAMYILAFWLCKGTMVPGQSYLFEIAEESSFLLCIIPAVSRLSRRYNLVVHLPAAHRLQLLQSTVFFIFISWPPGLCLFRFQLAGIGSWIRMSYMYSRIYDRCDIALLGFPG
jgi:hypothetical protein